MVPPGDQSDKPERPERPEYTVYKSRRGLFDRFRKPDISGLTDRLKRGGTPPKEPKAPKGPSAPDERPWWRRVLKWVGILALGWILLSLLAFAISAQIQKGKLVDGTDKELDGGPLMLASPQTILVLGTDVRSGGFGSAEEAESKACIEDVTSGKGSSGHCRANYRSDTIMLIRAGGGTFRKLSILRDTLAPIPDHGPDKLNSAYSIGGAKLAVRTVEDLLGLNVDQVAIIDFDGFREFIDTIGGITVDLPTPVCSSISGGEEAGGFTLELDPGENDLDGREAITLARTRSNECGTGDFASSDDQDRAAFQQLVLDGIKGKLTSITSAPMNFIKGPLIGWNAPKAMVSSMGLLSMPQFVLSAATGGGGDTEVLVPSGTTANGNLVISPDECRRAVEKLLGDDPPREPNCPQG
jgi:LCP family protein required for cell wall assembly